MYRYVDYLPLDGHWVFIKDEVNQYDLNKES